MIKKKIIPILLILVTVLGGCGKTTPETPQDSNKPKDEVSIPEKTDGDLFSKIQANFSSSSLSETYNSPIYSLEKDYVFKFECSEEAGNVAYKAFDVFDNSNYENIKNMSYAKVEYKDGKITISPSGALFLNETGSTNINDGTWGSLNKLYLVQYIDLETGKDLEKPIVTPFTIKHDVDAPTIKQGVDENNSYILSWEPVKNAVEYHVFEHFGDTGYVLECSTTNTSVSVEEFKTQQKSENYTDLVYKDLQGAGLDVTKDGIVYMNRGVKYTDNFDGYFTVVAIDKNGNQSGISNIVNVRDIAEQLPYRIVDSVYKKEIQTIEDVPTYVNVEMIDGSVKQMLINYHGAQTYKYTDNPNKISIRANVENTLFNSFLIVLTGKDYQDVMSEISYVTKRQDSLNVSGGSEEVVVNIPNTPLLEETDEDKMVAENIPEVESKPSTPEKPDVQEPTETPSEPEQPTETPETEPDTTTPDESNTPEKEPEKSEDKNTNTNVVVTPDGFTTAELMYSNAELVSERLNYIGADKIDKVLYANSDLEAWLALNFITQMDIITIPTEIFPEAANTDYLSDVLLEAFRQNPTSGMIENIGYSYQYESFVVQYRETAETRLDKTKEELEKAESVKNQLINNSMSDYEKVVAINNYFCKNAAYDFDSMSTNVEGKLSESYIDAHTPYGILVNNYGVCESYSEAFILVGRMAELEVLAELGTLQGGAHEWNRVKVDGSWCILDVTNNDLEIGKNALLNVTEEQSKELLTPDKTAYLNYEAHRANDSTKEYYYNSGSCAKNSEEAIELLLEQLSTSKEAAVRLPIGTSEDTAIEILRAVVKQGNYDPKAINYMAGVVSISIK